MSLVLSCKIKFYRKVPLCKLIKYLHPESVFHIEKSVFEHHDVNDVEQVHEAVVGYEPEVEALICFVFIENPAEWDYPGIIEETCRHHC